MFAGIGGPSRPGTRRESSSSRVLASAIGPFIRSIYRGASSSAEIRECFARGKFGIPFSRDLDPTLDASARDLTVTKSARQDRLPDDTFLKKSTADTEFPAAEAANYFPTYNGVIRCDAADVSNERLPTATTRPTPRPNDIGLNKIMNKLSVGHNKKYNRPPYVHDSRFIILLLPIDVRKIAPPPLPLPSPFSPRVR
jgi:hypothetical protein